MRLKLVAVGKDETCSIIPDRRAGCMGLKESGGRYYDLLELQVRNVSGENG